MSSTTITIHHQDANDTAKEQMYDNYLQEIADLENRLINLDSELRTMNDTLDGMITRRLLKFCFTLNAQSRILWVYLYTN